MLPTTANIALNFAKPKPDILSPDEFRRSRRATDYGASTDWWDEITRSTSYSLNQYISIDSSTKNGYFGASLNYKKGNGLDIVSKREEYGSTLLYLPVRYMRIGVTTVCLTQH